MGGAPRAEAVSFQPVEPAGEAGRDRLATARYGGRVAIEGLQAEYDAVTELAELTDGQMRAELELQFDGDDLYGPDGRSLTETARKGLAQAREQAKQNPNLWFEVGRRSLELEEILLAVDMVKRGTANTMMVTSNYPWALAGATEDAGGYNARRRQALHRAILVRGHKITLISQTLDGSRPAAMAAMHAEFGFRLDPGEEPLGQRRFMRLSDRQQDELMDRSRAAYDRRMAAEFGGEWYAGRQPIDYRNTYDFVCQQRDLIDMYKKLKLSGRLAEHMYDLAATINARFARSKYGRAETAPAPGFVGAAPHVRAESAVLWEMRAEGGKARLEGQTFSACGSTWEAEEGDGLTAKGLENAGFGGKGEKSWHGGKIFKNAKCVSCEKVKDEVGACHICEDCVKHPKKHGLGTVQGRTGDPKKAPLKREPARVFRLDDYRKPKAGVREAT